MRTLGLVDDSGSLDWWCWPRFDSPSVFGRLLDDDGGHWQIGPVDAVVARRQVYLSATNVLVTRMHTDTGVLEVDDLMVVGDARLIVRRARCVPRHRSTCGARWRSAPTTDAPRRLSTATTDGSIADRRRPGSPPSSRAAP